ncbi:ARM repeat superfamily protein [Perilla frutescens var. hirtella]|nr:ARM repeat superfamily protein [Perilla frutescens var. hirtella]KAH6808021.1 ARM repeat superfamily protein [Perilla frutescens var. frutescens]
MDLPPPQKRMRSASPPPPSFAGGAIDLSLLEALEKSQQNAVETLDLKTLKKLALSLERRLNANTAARLKYPDNPEKFADSELELHDELQKLKILAGAPELYPDLVSLGTVNSITGLLNHDNTDVAIDAVTLLQDLTDADVVEDNDESALVLVDALIENNAAELLVQNLARLNDSDPDEAAAIYNTLSTIENLIEVKPSVSELVCEKTKLLKWLQARIKIREFDSNKQYASEILAILLQNSAANQKRFGQMNGVDTLLQAVAMYKSKDPKMGDEEEMVENLFDCLCCVLMPLENKERFLKAEGVELMIIIMNQKKLCYGSAIRALDFAMTNYPPACERFVDVMGLKTAFPAFMAGDSLKTISLLDGNISGMIYYLYTIPLSKKNKKRHHKEELEERLISLIASLFGGILRGSRRERLLSKFVENECEKIDRLMELYMRYSDRVKAETERLNDLELDDLEIDEDEKYGRKLDSGLYTLQLIAVILGHLWTSEHPRMRARIELLLKQQKLTKNDVKNILQRGHQNSVELMPIFFILMVLGGIRHPQIAACLGAAYTVTRFFYFKGYSTGHPKLRLTIGKYGFLALFGLGLCAISSGLHMLTL